MLPVDSSGVVLINQNITEYLLRKEGLCTRKHPSYVKYKLVGSGGSGTLLIHVHVQSCSIPDGSGNLPLDIHPPITQVPCSWTGQEPFSFLFSLSFPFISYCLCYVARYATRFLLPTFGGRSSHFLSWVILGLLSTPSSTLIPNACLSLEVSAPLMPITERLPYLSQS